MTSRWLWVPLLVLGARGTWAGAEADVAAGVEHFLAEEASAHHFECGAVAIVVDGRLVLERGYGGNGPDQAPVDPAKTVFRAASTSKVFAAVAVLQLAERKSLRLDADVREYLPDVPLSNPSRTPLTLAHLLTHTSGIEPKMLGALALTPDGRVSLNEFFTRRGVRLTREPGRLVSYSNLGIALAGLIVERVAKNPYERYVEENIFVPLGMTSTSFRQPLPSDLDARLVKGRRPAPFIIPYPAGSMAGTAHDMGLFLGALLNEGGTVLSPESTNLLVAPHWRAHPDAPGVAYGFFEAFHNGLRVLQHTGDGGHHSILLLVPERRFGLYFVSATDDARAIPLRGGLERVALDALAPPPPSGASAQVPKVRGDGRAYAGLWRGADRVESSIEKIFSFPFQGIVRSDRNGSLRITSFGGGISEGLTPLATDLFRGSDDGWYAFQRNASGHLDTLTISGEGTDPVTFRRAGPLEDARVHLGIVLLFGLTILSVPVLGIMRKLRKSSTLTVTLPAKIAARTQVVVATIAFMGPLVVVAGFFLNRPPYEGLPGQVIVGIVLLHVLVTLVFVETYFAVRAWREAWWSRAYRTYYSVTAAAGLAFTGILLYWNVLGFRF